ncbi:hypothetical protein BKA70DRAFT_1223460 [Coprinopsis sp. MPI-PUGE-AT-0042]|nr:hypothetical protein BKA70DRAFT_1223460 [Coprinopsis sp. MPI-PUGE-AT-0042]
MTFLGVQRWKWNWRSIPSSEDSGPTSTCQWVMVVNEEPSLIATDSQQTQMMQCAPTRGDAAQKLKGRSPLTAKGLILLLILKSSKKGGLWSQQLYEALYDNVMPGKTGFGSNIRRQYHCHARALDPPKTSLGTIESFVKPAFTKRLGFSVKGEAFLDEEVLMTRSKNTPVFGGNMIVLAEPYYRLDRIATYNSAGNSTGLNACCLPRIRTKLMSKYYCSS